MRVYKCNVCEFENRGEKRKVKKKMEDIMNGKSIRHEREEGRKRKKEKEQRQLEVIEDHLSPGVCT